jgi:hypothetical protein
MTHKSKYDWFTSVANNWGTIHPILDMPPPLLDEEEVPPTEKELDPRITHADPPSHHDEHGQTGVHHLSAHRISST